MFNSKKRPLNSKRAEIICDALKILLQCESGAAPAGDKQREIIESNFRRFSSSSYQMRVQDTKTPRKSLSLTLFKPSSFMWLSPLFITIMLSHCAISPLPGRNDLRQQIGAIFHRLGNNKKLSLCNRVGHRWNPIPHCLLAWMSRFQCFQFRSRIVTINIII